MARRVKLLDKAKQNPNGLWFGEFETLLERCGWIFDRQRGSHRVWISPKGSRLSVQAIKGGKAKEYQVRQFLSMYKEEDG